MLETGFCEIDGVDPAEMKARMAASSGSPLKEVTSEKKSSHKKIKAKGDETKCQFCGRVDKTFANNEILDMHFWKDCLMLTECKHCSQVIEIETYNQHLLKECEKSTEF